MKIIVNTWRTIFFILTILFVGFNLTGQSESTTPEPATIILSPFLPLLYLQTLDAALSLSIEKYRGELDELARGYNNPASPITDQVKKNYKTITEGLNTTLAALMQYKSQLAPIITAQQQKNNATITLTIQNAQKLPPLVRTQLAASFAVQIAIQKKYIGYIDTALKLIEPLMTEYSAAIKSWGTTPDFFDCLTASNRLYTALAAKCALLKKQQELRANYIKQLESFRAQLK